MSCMKVVELVKKDGIWIFGREFELSGTRNLIDLTPDQVVQDIMSENITREELEFGWFFIDSTDKNLKKWQNIMIEAEAILEEKGVFKKSTLTKAE